ncbi:helix-turn-helix domain-containing protein [Natronorubrum sp. JWXQ-INN-674]|uniref:Helix-turn-helix domain-containing protein n=1 Tax=Natronorubrum halalkaliphilum TaxID=2691917 RepID=A0A6B0VNF9_9EURY|nr:winged helix-turn-helix domain-containing protein [Natronorubrum halalkaliphilum]MXV63321.1 helix-turn-helix domain-containing protein [Natronorubrum halalkaliphilum]
MSPGYESEANGAYSESSPFVHLFATPSRAKLLDLFLRKHYEEVTASDVETLTGVSRSSFHRNIGALEALGIIEQTGTTGNSKTYRLNKESELAKTLASAHADILDHATKVLDDSSSRINAEIAASIEASIERDRRDYPGNADTDDMREQVVKAITG